MAEDWYALLGVSRSATDQEIKAAYRELALLHHPDRNPDDADSVRAFMRVKAAYEVLSDPAERRFYDQELAYAERPLSDIPSPAYVVRPPVEPLAPRSAWTVRRALITGGAMMAARGFLGVYAVTWSPFLQSWFAVAGGRDRAFLLMLLGVAVALFGFGRKN